jgi:hypothetical protein
MTLNINKLAEKWWLENRNVVFGQTEAFEFGYTRAIEDVVEFLRTETMNFGGDWCMNNGGHWGEDYAKAIEEKFLKGQDV